MIQQFFFREFSSVNRRVERFLRKSKHLRMIDKETDPFENRVVYSVGYRWSILKVTMISKTIRLSLIRIDGSITRVEISIVRNGEQIDGMFSLRTTKKLLHTLSY